MADDVSPTKIAGVGGAIAGLIGGVLAWMRSRSDDSSKFRQSIMKRIEQMEARDNDQQELIDRLRHDLQNERERGSRQNIVIWRLADLVKKLMGEQNELLVKHGQPPKYTERDWVFPEIEYPDEQN